MQHPLPVLMDRVRERAGPELHVWNLNGGQRSCLQMKAWPTVQAAGQLDFKLENYTGPLGFWFSASASQGFSVLICGVGEFFDFIGLLWD